MASLFPDNILAKTEEEIGHTNDTSTSVSVYAQTCVNLRRNQAIYAHIIHQGVKTDGEVFVKRNIDISSVHEAILYLFQFQNKNGRFPAVYLSLRMRGIKRSRGEEFTRSRMRIRVIQLQNPPKDARFLLKA